MVTHDIYYDILLFCGIVITSYSLGWVSRLTRVPSVLLLIGLGVAGQFILKTFGLQLDKNVFSLLQLLGIVGLIMIVLEAALDLKLTREKRPLILKAMGVALVALAVSSVALTKLIQYFLGFEFQTALIHAIPLSIISSAIIIPSVRRLSEDKKEFMIYESTFSDIFGIMLFYFVVAANETSTPVSIVKEVSFNILLTLALSLLVSYLLVLLFQRILESARLFLLISVLIALYATGKIFHLSSLVVILTFGLILSNYKLFFSGKLSQLIKGEAMESINKEFHLVTLESAFVVRTFFFVVFGVTLDLNSLLDKQTAVISLGLIFVLYVARLIGLWPFKKHFVPELWIAPRGLITILLFFAIPEPFIKEEFSSGILLYVILSTGLVMTLAMIFYQPEPPDVEELQFTSLEELDKELIKQMKNDQAIRIPKDGK